MRFELPATRTLEFTGSRTVPVLSCGADKQSFTVALIVKVNGEKLPPKVIFKGVRQLNINTPPRMQISVHKKGWMDEEGMFYLHTVYSEKELFERATNTILGIRNCICCHGYHVTEHVLLSTYANFHLFAFLLKSFSILKVSKVSQIVILRFCYVKILGYKTHPNFSTNLPPKHRFFLKKPCAL